MKILFAITIILAVFSSLSVWFILNDVFKKKLQDLSDDFQKDLLIPTKTNEALQKDIPIVKADLVTNIDSFINIKMDIIYSGLKLANDNVKIKNSKEKPVSIEEKDLSINPVFKLSDLAPLMAFKNVKDIFDNLINKEFTNKDFTQDKLKGKPVAINDGLIDFVNKRKKEISQIERYKLEFGKKWVDDLKNQKKEDKAEVFKQLNIIEKPKDKDGKPTGFTELTGDLKGLETLLQKPTPANVNLFFAIDYFSPTLFSVIKASNFGKDPKKDMAIIEEKRKDFIKLYEDYKKVHDKVFLELLKKDNK
jgi:hypothetical protein